MKVIGLDLSTKTGWAVIDNLELRDHGNIIVKDKNDYSVVPDYAQINRANSLALELKKIIQNHNPDMIIIEQTNAGSFRTSQKQLEFIHFAVLTMIESIGAAKCVKYVDTSQWRRGLSISLSKEQRIHNKQVKKKSARGKITWKHLSVAWANKTYNINLKLLHNDIADAIALASYGIIKYGKKHSEIKLEEIF